MHSRINSWHSTHAVDAPAFVVVPQAAAFNPCFAALYTLAHQQARESMQPRSLYERLFTNWN
jgi:hypothetical protein